MTSEASIPNKDLGLIYTPATLAKFLVNWAIRDPSDVVVDIGTGDGVFLIEAYERLMALGAEPHAGTGQLLGVEVDRTAFDAFEQRWRSEVGDTLPDVKHASLFDTELPTVDAVVGNPPYVARTRLPKVDLIRRRVFGPEGTRKGFGRLTDLYAYFLVYASRYLRPGGRLAVIVSSSWMNANYGRGLKTFLRDEFALRAIYAFDRKIFPDASVKPVLLLAEKTLPALTPNDNPVRFIRMREKFSPTVAREALSASGDGAARRTFTTHIESQSRLDLSLPWGIYLKAPAVYFSLLRNPLTTEMGAVAYTRIGLQTLAKDFYVLGRQRAEEMKLEPEYRQPIAFSPRESEAAVLDESHVPNWFAFYCDKSKGELCGTRALRHIEWGERQLVRTRGRTTTVTGYQNQRRIQQARRRPWYNIKSEIDRRGRLPILIPRRIYERYLVLWNKIALIPNEDFIEATPNQEGDLVPLLAVLNSSYMEFMFRTHAQVYGGGVFNLNPGPARRVPTVNIRLLGETARRRLEEAYSAFVAQAPRAKEELDRTVFDVLGLREHTRRELLHALQGIRDIARRSKQGG